MSIGKGLLVLLIAVLGLMVQGCAAPPDSAPGAPSLRERIQEGADESERATFGMTLDEAKAQSGVEGVSVTRDNYRITSFIRHAVMFKEAFDKYAPAGFGHFGWQAYIAYLLFYKL